MDRELSAGRPEAPGNAAFANFFLCDAGVLPASLTRIADDAFTGDDDLSFTVHAGSYAERWCKANDLPIMPTDEE